MEEMIKDFRGRELRVGTEVVCSKSTAAALRIGKIKSITGKNTVIVEFENGEALGMSVTQKTDRRLVTGEKGEQRWESFPAPYVLAL